MFSRVWLLNIKDLGNLEGYGKGMAFYFTDDGEKKSEIFISLIDRGLWREFERRGKKRLATYARMREGRA